MDVLERSVTIDINTIETTELAPQPAVGTETGKAARRHPDLPRTIVIAVFILLVSAITVASFFTHEGNGKSAGAAATVVRAAPAVVPQIDPAMNKKIDMARAQQWLMTYGSQALAAKRSFGVYVSGMVSSPANYDSSLSTSDWCAAGARYADQVRALSLSTDADTPPLWVPMLKSYGSMFHECSVGKMDSARITLDSTVTSILSTLNQQMGWD